MSPSRRPKNARSQLASKQALANISRRCSTNPLWRPLSGDPSTVATPGSKYINRVYAFKLNATAGANTSLTIGAVNAILAGCFSGSAQYKVRNIKCWNSRIGGSLIATVFPSAVSSNTDPSIVAEDFGTSTSLAKAHLVLPDVISTSLAVSSASTNTILQVSDPSAGTGIVSNFIVHLTLSVSV